MSDWSAPRKKSFITSVIRAGFRKFPNKFSALKKASVGKKLNPTSGRLAEHYKCASCKKPFVGAKVQVDHICPVVDPERGFVSWDEFINRLFCEEDNLAVLCLECHSKKTKEEAALRAKHRKK